MGIDRIGMNMPRRFDRRQRSEREDLAAVRPHRRRGSPRSHPAPDADQVRLPAGLSSTQCSPPAHCKRDVPHTREIAVSAENAGKFSVKLNFFANAQHVRLCRMMPRCDTKGGRRCFVSTLRRGFNFPDHADVRAGRWNFKLLRDHRPSQRLIKTHGGHGRVDHNIRGTDESASRSLCDREHRESDLCRDIRATLPCREAATPAIPPID